MEDLASLPHCVSYSLGMQHRLTAASAAEDGELLELTSQCRVTSAERSLTCQDTPGFTSFEFTEPERTVSV